MIRDLPSLEKAVSDLEAELLALKNVQFIGTSSLKAYKTGTNLSWDWDVQNINNPQRRYRLRFDFATAKKGAIVRLSTFYRIENGNVMQDPVPSSPPTAPALQLEVVPEDVQDTYMTWQVFIFNNTFNGAFPEALDIYVKFFFDGTDTGTWSIQPL